MFVKMKAVEIGQYLCKNCTTHDDTLKIVSALIR